MGLKMCKKHRSLCAEAIQKRGLSHLVSKSQSEAVKRITADMNSKVPTRNYDPMLSLVMTIHKDTVNFSFEGNKLVKDKKNYCPLCLVEQKNSVEDCQIRIDSLADEIYQMCEKYSLQG